MTLTKRFYLTEHLVYLVFWISLFLIPIVGFCLGRDHFMGTDMSPLYGALLLLTVFFILFLINSYVLLPKLFMQHHISSYVVTSLLLCIVAAVTGQQIENYYHQQNRMKRELPMNRTTNPSLEKMPPPPNGSYRFHKKGFPPHSQGMTPEVDMLFHYPQANFTLFILSVLVVSFNLAVRLVFSSMKEDLKDKTLAKERISSELEYLKYQINPHFLMNTLNNIQALVDLDSEKAKANIIKLSKMMRFVLYKGPLDMVLLSEEIEFLENYIDLMRIRYIDQVKIEFSYPSAAPPVQLPSLLIVPFVENAFKHGVSYEKSSHIFVKIDYINGRIDAVIENTKAEISMKKDSNEGGIGLENTKKRLDLIYGTDYKLDIRDENDTYFVELNIKPL